MGRFVFRTIGSWQHYGRRSAKLVEENKFPMDIRSIIAGHTYSMALTKNEDVWNSAGVKAKQVSLGISRKCLCIVQRT